MLRVEKSGVPCRNQCLEDGRKIEVPSAGEDFQSFRPPAHKITDLHEIDLAFEPLDLGQWVPTGDVQSGAQRVAVKFARDRLDNAIDMLGGANKVWSAPFFWPVRTVIGRSNTVNQGRFPEREL